MTRPRSRRRLSRDRSGVAMLEFALSLPIVLGVGVWAIETGNFALTNLRVSQIALNLADNASRVGAQSGATVQLREYDMNDVLQAARLQGDQINLTTNGRITVSSLESDNGVIRVHWQRCIGLKADGGTEKYEAPAVYKTDPLDGTTDNTNLANYGTLAPLGMADLNASPAGTAFVIPPLNAGVIVVEINYDYQPVIGKWLFPASKIHYVASYIVRDRRDFSQIYPYTGVTASTCDKHTV